MAVPIRSQQYHDPMAAQRRHRRWFVRSFGVIFAIGALAAAGYGISRLHLSIPWPRRQATAQIQEPVAVGTWCIGQECRLFDHSGAPLGDALPSSGPLLLLVDDQRASTSLQAPLAVGIITAAQTLPDMGLTAKKVILSDAQPGATIVTSRAYTLYIDAIGDVADQMATLKVFLSDRAKDPGFAPVYIDLRTPGRVYVK